MEFLKQILRYLRSILFSISLQPIPEVEQQDSIEPEPEIPVPQPISEPVVVTDELSFDSPKKAWHAVRVLCDESGLPLRKDVFVPGFGYFFAKDILCACIYQESRFRNDATHSNAKSTDWGICQINDRYQVGPRLPFSSAEEIVNNPKKAVLFMISCYKQGNLGLWVSYSSGAYKQWLSTNSPMWELASA